MHWDVEEDAMWNFELAAELAACEAVVEARKVVLIELRRHEEKLSTMEMEAVMREAKIHYREEQLSICKMETATLEEQFFIHEVESSTWEEQLSIHEMEAAMQGEALDLRESHSPRPRVPWMQASMRLWWPWSSILRRHARNTMTNSMPWKRGA